MAFLDGVLGATFMACIITAIFYGVTCLQTIYYFMKSQGDGVWMKMLVSGPSCSMTLVSFLAIRQQLCFRSWFCCKNISNKLIST
ncbi:hypothetical protein SCHPADRAFT_57490 [Schizopora paradoxa]|uniref:Uncharacterized protein n=1 Tax=Schizopora paradoxa TaxID=27342 RepID=A0A0H2S6X7_9AGAM|nr:hypothetical protein SCHPADRAFT_57490 [Schizopora paradoxa]